MTPRNTACDLGRIPVDQYLHSTNIVARLNLPNMAYSPERRIEVYASAQDGLAELEPSTERQLKYVDYIDQYANLSRDEWEAYQSVQFSVFRGRTWRLARLKTWTSGNGPRDWPCGFTRNSTTAGTMA